VIHADGGGRLIVFIYHSIVLFAITRIICRFHICILVYTVGWIMSSCTRVYNGVGEGCNLKVKKQGNKKVTAACQRQRRR
jgi:hypothetical protein